MHTNIQAVILLSFSLTTMLLTTAAHADDSVSIRIYNDGADNMVVTVYDMNAQPPGAVLASQRINGFAWIPVSVTAGAVGNDRARAPYRDVGLAGGHRRRPRHEGPAAVGV